MKVRWLPLSVGEARASRISSMSELATSWDQCRFCMRWSVDILSIMMHTLFFSCISLRAIRIAFASAWKDKHHLPLKRVH